MFGADAPLSAWHVTFDHANLSGSVAFDPVPPASALWNAGDGQTVKLPKCGKGDNGNGNGQRQRHGDRQRRPVAPAAAATAAATAAAAAAAGRRRRRRRAGTGSLPLGHADAVTVGRA